MATIVRHNSYDPFLERCLAVGLDSGSAGSPLLCADQMGSGAALLQIVAENHEANGAG